MPMQTRFSIHNKGPMKHLKSELLNRKLGEIDLRITKAQDKSRQQNTKKVDSQAEDVVQW
jgi:hypothetical protein